MTDRYRRQAMTRSRAAYTIPEFCDEHRISRGSLYNMWGAGVGPRYLCVGRKRLITIEAAAAWRAEGERQASKSA